MRRLKAVVTVLLLAFWLPATSHVLLESAGWIHTEHTEHADADHDSGTDNDHDAADGICQVVSTNVQVPHPDLNGSTTPFWCLDFTLILDALLELSLAAPNGPAPPGAAPPELSQTWQFSSRASLPARAPSIAS